jgi:hypothetical protein
MTAGTSALLVLIGGGAATVAIMTKGEPRTVQAVAGRGSVGTAPGNPLAPVSEPGAAALGGGRPPVAGAGAAGGTAATGARTSNEADRTATRTPRQLGAGADPGGTTAAPPAAAPGTTPAVTTQTVSETRAIPYRTRLVRDPAMPRGQRRVETEGINGEETLRWLVTFAGGRQTERRLIDSTVTRQPQHQVVAFGWQGALPGRGPARGQGQGQGQGHGRGNGHWPGRGHRRECGVRIGACLPLGRGACPTPPPAGDPTADQTQAANTKALTTNDTAPKGGATTADQAQAEENAVQLGGSVTLTDEDLALLTPADLAGLEIDPGTLCP